MDNRTLQLAAVKAVLVTATIISSGWLSQLPRIDSLFIHHIESLLTNALIMTVVFFSSLGSTTPFSRTSSLSQHTCVLVMDQEERHALLSNVQMPNWALNLGKFQPQQNVSECAPDSQRTQGEVSEENFRD